MVVAEGAQETRLGAIGFDVSRIGAGYTAFCELGIAGLADELIADRDLVIDPVVERFEEGVSCRPVHIVEVPDIGVVPGDDGFVGGELLGLPVLAQVLREALVNTADIGFAGRALLAGHGEAQVQAGEDGLIVARVFIDRGRGEAGNGEGLPVQVIGTCPQAHEQSERSEDSDGVDEISVHMCNQILD